MNSSVTIRNALISFVCTEARMPATAADQGAQRGPRQHDSGELLELDFRLLR